MNCGLPRYPRFSTALYSRKAEAIESAPMFPLRLVRVLSDLGFIKLLKGWR